MRSISGHPRLLLEGNRLGDLPSRGWRSSCLTRHTTSPQRWPPALSTRPIDATTTMEMTGPAILTSSRSSTWADEPSRSATTVAETQASFPSARPTAWRTPTAKKPTGTRYSIFSFMGGVSRRPTGDERTSGASRRSRRVEGVEPTPGHHSVPARTRPPGLTCHRPGLGDRETLELSRRPCGPPRSRLWRPSLR